MRVLFLLVYLCFCSTCAYAQALPALIPYTDGARWGYADTTGRIRIAPQWREARPFDNGKAIVLFESENSGHVSGSDRPVVCLIDEQGRYIIGPGAGWNGIWQGWEKTALNAVDSSGKWGMIDANGIWQVTRKWSLPPGGNIYPLGCKGFQVVFSHGMAGLVNRRDELVVPCIWGTITTAPALQAIGAFQVQDPDNVGGINSYGLIDSTGRVLLPPRYASIRLLRNKKDGTVLQVTTAAYNQAPTNNSNNNPTQTRFIDLATGRTVPPVSEATDQYEQAEPGGLISFYQTSPVARGVMDSNRNIIIPCCNVFSVTQDTITLRSFRTTGDSLIVTTSYLHTRTRRPIGSPDSIVLYQEAPRAWSSRYTPHGNSYPYPEREHPYLMIGEHRQEQFYKDSFRYTVSDYANGKGDDRLYIISGRVGEGYATYFAVVDSNLQYILPPSTEQIIHYNPDDEIVTAVANDDRTGKRGYLLRSRAGSPLMFTGERALIAGFRWKGKIFAYSLPAYGEGGAAISEGAVLLDAAGLVVPALRKLSFPPARQSPERYVRYPEFSRKFPSGQMAGIDGERRVHIVFPDGTTPYPALNGKYLSLTPVTGDWFLGMDEKGVRHFVDGRNDPVLRNINFTDVRPVYLVPDNYYPHRSAPQAIPRLLIVNALDRFGKGFWFYLDDTGRVYARMP